MASAGCTVHSCSRQCGRPFPSPCLRPCPCGAPACGWAECVQDQGQKLGGCGQGSREQHSPVPSGQPQSTPASALSSVEWGFSQGCSLDRATDLFTEPAAHINKCLFPPTSDHLGDLLVLLFLSWKPLTPQMSANLGATYSYAKIEFSFGFIYLRGGATERKVLHPLVHSPGGRNGWG